MINIVKKYFPYVIIIILIILLVLERINKPKPIDNTVVRIDTLWLKRDTVYIKVPTFITSFVPKIITDTRYIPDANYSKLNKQYGDLLTLHFSKNIVKDTIDLKKYGFIQIVDTINQNKIISRKYTQQLRIPVVTKETIITEHKTQLYIGGAIQGSSTSLLNQITAGVLLKNKKDQMYGVYTGVDMSGKIQFGLESYWKIHFKK